jgi:ribosomal protein S18 acetylase RimI-like enzyme
MKIIVATEVDLDAVMSLVASCILHMESKNIAQWVLNEHQDPEYSDVAWAHCEGKALIVHRLSVHPDAQGQNVATRLMDFAEHRAIACGYSAIRLDAFTENPAAVLLYEKRGYRRAGTVVFRKGPFYCFEKGLKREECSNKSGAPYL